MRKFALQRITPCIVAFAISLSLAACSKKSECNLPYLHAHRYIKDFGNGITISKYLEQEDLDYYGYNWTEDSFEITKEDEMIFGLNQFVYDRTVNWRDLFNGKENWSYLFHLMSSKHDYLKFYYEYTETNTTFSFDEDGNVTTETKTETYSGYTDNPYYTHNTGKVKLCHHRYYGYKIIFEDGHYKLVRSEDVDDIKKIIYAYPYYTEKCYEIIPTYHYFDKDDLPSLKPEDFHDFDQPDLTDDSLSAQTLTLKKDF